MLLGPSKGYCCQSSCMNAGWVGTAYFSCDPDIEFLTERRPQGLFHEAALPERHLTSRGANTSLHQEQLHYGQETPNVFISMREYPRRYILIPLWFNRISKEFCQSLHASCLAEV